MSDFGLVESFGIDDGELDDKSPQQCFVLGYEFATLCGKLSDRESGAEPIVHVDNMSRIEKAAAKRGRVVEWKRLDDESEQWISMRWRTR